MNSSLKFCAVKFYAFQVRFNLVKEFLKDLL